MLVNPSYRSLGVHGLLFLLTFWWSMGAGNLAYALWKYVDDSQRRVVHVGRGVTCSNCGTGNPADAAYCRSCGERLPDAGGTRTCSDCGTRVAASDRYCPNSGHAFVERETAA